MTKAKLDQLVAYVNKSMDRAGGVTTNNISISLPPLKEKDLAYLRKHFLSVELQGFFGYVAFKREVPVKTSTPR